MSVQVETTIEIRQPIDVVFATLTDVANHPKWVSAVAEIRNLSYNPVNAATTWQQAGKFMGRELIGNVEVVAHEPPHKFAIRSEGTGIGDGQLSWTLEPITTGTRIGMAADLEPGGFVANLAVTLLKGAIKKQIEGDMQSLKRLLESQ
jgi:carbon monoxide dehydrogenase subunit G